MADIIQKVELLKALTLKKTKWMALKSKDKEQDTTYENFISDVILVLDWVIDDVERM